MQIRVKRVRNLSLWDHFFHLRETHCVLPIIDVYIINRFFNLIISFKLVFQLVRTFLYFCKMKKLLFLAFLIISVNSSFKSGLTIPANETFALEKSNSKIIQLNW